MTHKKIYPHTYETRVRHNSGYSYASSSLDYLASSIHNPAGRIFLVPTFVITACTVVEASINDCYIDHFQYQVGDDYLKIGRPFLYLGYRERLIVLFPVISTYRYVLDETHPKVRALFDLFELRGRLIHVKHKYRPAIVTEIEKGLTTLSVAEADPLDPYDGDYLQPLRLINTKKAYRLTKFWTRYLDGLHWRIRRRNFNAQGLLKPAKRNPA